MALTGIDIFKKLPRTNCGACGVPTCLAFAMKLAAGQAELALCPHVSEEAKAFLAEAAAPPIRTVTIGVGPDALKVGGETVLFRHEKTFVNPPGLAILINDTDSEAELAGKIASLKELHYLRVGRLLKAELAALKNASGDPARFKALAEKVKAAGVGNLILMSDQPAALSAALEAVGDLNPLLYAASPSNAEGMGKLAAEKKLPLAVKGANVEETVTLAEQMSAVGVKDLVLDSGARRPAELLRDQTAIRRAALEKKFRPLGFPTIVFPCEMSNDPLEEAMSVGLAIAKYAGLIVLSELKGETLFPLLLERLNIYTDPQRPMMTEQAIYPINNPTADSPVLVTCNFSLTYFIVSGEVEGSKTPSWLVVVDTEGLSVLTAWAAGKFNGDTIAAQMKKMGIPDKVSHRRVVIPGSVAIISSDLEEELGEGWRVLIGPREAAHIPNYLKNIYPTL